MGGAKVGGGATPEIPSLSQCAITARALASSQEPAMICRPTGSPSTKPAGTLPAGTPVRFAKKVKRQSSRVA